MKSMKKLILTGLSLLFAVTLVFAQSANPEEKAKEKVATLTEKLALTQEQQEPIYKVLVEVITTKEALKADTTISEEDKAQRIDGLKTHKSEKIKEILTDEQKEAYDKLLAEKKEEA